ncbi:MAG: hypothetical protein ABIG39_04285 [Candidatus Micrarchaeota archaeon]
MEVVEMSGMNLFVKRNSGNGFRKATAGDMGDQSGMVFFRKHTGGMGLDRMNGETFVPMGSRTTLFARNGSDAFHPATEKEARGGNAYCYKHDAVMPDMEPVGAVEFKRNRWKYEVVQSVVTTRTADKKPVGKAGARV